MTRAHLVTKLGMLAEGLAALLGHNVVFREGGIELLKGEWWWWWLDQGMPEELWQQQQLHIP